MMISISQLCLYLIYLTFRCHADPETLVRTNFGTVQGRLVELNIPGVQLDPIVEFLGVPYATAPLGRKRFMPPNSPSKWSTTKDCTRLPSACIQKFPNSFLAGETEALKWMPSNQYKYLKRLRSLLENEAEDCLYLNLYVPRRKESKQNSQLLPVLMLIHGGSYSWGSGNVYNGSILASYGRIIVVTLNYRLGIFGFLSAGYQAPLCRGNWALGDIAAALEFLRQTVADFGGDPRLITLMGWDTGAAMVNLLMSSPVSAPAHSRSFQRSILLGGSALSNWATVPNPTDAFFYVAKALGCAKIKMEQKPNERRNVNAPELIHNITNCLMAAPIDKILNICRDMEPPTYISTFGPTIDGSIVANDPHHNLRQHSDLFKQLDLLVGVTRNEAFHLLSNEDLVNGMEKGKRDDIFRTLVQNMFRFHRNEIFSSILNEYSDWQSPNSGREVNNGAVLRALSDGLYVAPLIDAARIHSRPKRPFNNEELYGRLNPRQISSSTSSSTWYRSQHGTTYMYVFAHQTDGLDRGRLSESVHGEDLPYILGYPLLGQPKGTLFDYNYGNVERSLSEAMMRYISNFVKTGDPMRPIPIRTTGDYETLARLAWPQFVADVSEGYLHFGEKPRDDSFYQAHEVAFWTKFLPSLEKAGETASNERHHQFPNKATFYGVVRPAGRFGEFWRSTINPASVTPSPTQPRGKTTITPPDPTKITPSPSASPSVPQKYSTILSVTVAVGCALLILNVLIFAGIYHQWDKHKRFRKRQENHYQPAPVHLPQQPVRPDLGPMVATVNSTLNTPMSGHHGSLDRSMGQVGGHRVPPAPPPPQSVSALDSELHSTLTLPSKAHQGRQINRQMLQLVQLQQPSDIVGIPHVGIHSEQEPLLNRTYISPNCPRHGKHAVAPAGSAGTMSSLEEIQV